MKFLLFISIVVSLWYVMRWIQQAEQSRRLREDRSAGRAHAARRAMRATDTIICPRCGTYVPAEFPSACARTDCPFPGVG
jgi:hypothetical protein